jgi:AcrR family transcriptional regulator
MNDRSHLAKKMKYSREYILRRAFDVFMEKGYDSTSISVLQKELNMSRGAMYRYFTNKEELLCSVIDEYFFKVFNRVLQLRDENMKVPELIEFIHRRQRLMIPIFNKAGFTHVVFLNYTALLIQGAKYYPNFACKFNQINQLAIQHWMTALNNSIKSKEVKEDINIETMAKLFNNVSVHESSDHCSDDSKFVVQALEDIENRKQVMDYLYSLIRV